MVGLSMQVTAGSSTSTMVGFKTIDKMDKLADAMAKVKFAAPRGPFRFDPVTHNPIQNVYFCEEQQKGDRIVSTVIGTHRDVQAPPTKSG